MNAKELHETMFKFSHSFFLVDARNHKSDFFAVSPEEMKKYWLCYSGQFLNYVMDGKLKEAWDIIDSIQGNELMKIGLSLVHPEITWQQFVEKIEYLKSINQPLACVVLTAGRPSLLNGFNDFSRIGPALVNNQNIFIDYGKYLYGEECSLFIYKLCLAEFYYQRGKLLEAEVLVSQTIKEFDKKSEMRLLFAALYLQSKILLAHKENVNAATYIKEIRKYIREVGYAEFSYNLDAAEVLYAFYDGDYALINNWLKKSAPDEYLDFNMLDLYRYMIKIRCYIVTKKYAALVALCEKLRPLLEAGRRYMDLCELDLLLAMSLYSSGNRELAFEALDRALKIAKKHSYYRLVADEGEIMLHLLLEYAEIKGMTPILMKIIELTREMAIRYPLYLKVQIVVNGKFTKMEVDILKLIEQGKCKDEIAEYFLITVNTVKYHMKKIYSKLHAKNSCQAIWNAKLLGIL